MHIHIAEQVKEVDDCIAWSGQRPVEWLLDHQELSSRWCLIHATHMTDAETMRMAEAGAIAGLCPVTEANLGDGTFNATVFHEAGGKFGVGSDSNVLIGISDELRQYEYSQRLLHRARNVLAENAGSTGRALFDGAVTGGNIAMGRASDGLEAGLRPISSHLMRRVCHMQKATQCSMAGFLAVAHDRPMYGCAALNRWKAGVTACAMRPSVLSRK